MLIYTLYTAVREQPQSSVGSDQGSIRLFLEHNADQMSNVNRYNHQCFRAKMSDKSHLASHPGL